jgi:hypothetical protein
MDMNMRPLILIAALSAAAPAAAESFSADYSVSLFGLPVAKSSFTTRIEGDRFEMSGSLSSAGVAKIFDDTEGTTSASGRFAEGSVRPESYVVSYTSGKKKKKTVISFSDGDVTKTENVPPLKKRKNYVALGEGDLKSVADPLSATLVKAESLEEVCDRTVKIYDGEMRADLKLSTVAMEPLWPSSYDGEAITCQARFVPVSGYRKGKDSIEFLKDKARIMIAFAPLGTTGVYAPVQASVSTEIGTIRIEAQRLEQE